MFKSFGKDLLQYFPSQILPVILAFVSIPFFTRVLSAEQFGDFVLIRSSMQFMLVLTSWLRITMLRFYPAVSAQEVGVLVRTAFWTQFVLISGIGLITCIGMRIVAIDAKLESLVGIGVLVFILKSVFQLLLSLLRVQRQVSTFSVITIWEEVTSLGLGVLLVGVFHLGVAGILWGNVLGLAVVLPFLWRIIYKDIGVIGSISFPLFRELTRYGGPLIMCEITAWVLVYMDRYQVQMFYSAREVGIYAAAYTLSQYSIAFLGTLFRLSSTPILMNVWEKQGREASMRLLNSVTRLYLLIGIPMVFGMSVLAEPIMRVLTGAEFIEGYKIIPWIAGGAFFLGLQSRFDQVLALVKRTSIPMLNLTICGMINIALNWWLLPIYTYQVAAVTTLVCYVLLCITQAFASRQFLLWPFPWTTAGRSMCSAVLMYIGALLLMRTSDLPPIGILIIAVPFSVLIYGIFIWISGEISPKERNTLQEYGRRFFVQKTI